MTSTNSRELTVKVAGSVDRKVDMIENFMISESHEKRDSRKSYKKESNPLQWVVNTDIASSDTVMVFKEFEIPSDVQLMLKI